jgi:hypothetical protein
MNPCGSLVIPPIAAEYGIIRADEEHRFHNQGF